MGERIIPEFVKMISLEVPSAFIVDSLQQFIEKFEKPEQIKVISDQFSAPLVAKLKSIPFKEYPELFSSLVQCASSLLKQAKQLCEPIIPDLFDISAAVSLETGNYLLSQKKKMGTPHKKLLEYNHYMVSLLLSCMDNLVSILEILEKNI